MRFIAGNAACSNTHNTKAFQAIYKTVAGQYRQSFIDGDFGESKRLYTDQV
jgi:hypothetical protein